MGGIFLQENLLTYLMVLNVLHLIFYSAQWLSYVFNGGVIKWVWSNSGPECHILAGSITGPKFVTGSAHGSHFVAVCGPPELVKA